METNQVVGINPLMICMRETCGLRSRRVAGSKRRAQVFYFSVRICYIFLISKCRGEPDLALRTTLGLIHVAFMTSQETV